MQVYEIYSEKKTGERAIETSTKRKRKRQELRLRVKTKRGTGIILSIIIKNSNEKVKRDRERLIETGRDTVRETRRRRQKERGRLMLQPTFIRIYKKYRQFRFVSALTN